MSAMTAASLGLDTEGTILGGPLAPETPITGVVVDSRETTPGSVFVAIKGAARDGAEFIPFAVRMQAAAIIASLEGAITALEQMNGICPVPLIVVEDPRASLARLAARLHTRQPSCIAAITGTSGKTSTAEFLRQIWRTLGHEAASLGTLGIASEAVSIQGGLTTPDPVKLHEGLEKLAEAGVTHLAMEASSHGLDQHRLDGVQIGAAALTNLARDHMDYHPTTAHYAAAKLRLFSDLAPEGAFAVVNADEPVLPLIAQIAAARGLRLMPIGEGEAADAGGIRLLSRDYAEAGQRIRFTFDGIQHSIDLPLIGAFQARNALMAAGLAIGSGAAAQAAFAALEKLEGVRGRMELAATRANGAPIFVDYAHKPDALAAALKGLRPHVDGRLHVVFGAGGDRDQGKRPLMGDAAREHADVVIVTDDNPRSEDPASIRAAIMHVLPEATEIADRAEAILTAVDGLEPGDALLIAGKGHESGQIIAGEVHPFDDGEQARMAVVALDSDDDDVSSMLGRLL